VFAERNATTTPSTTTTSDNVEKTSATTKEKVPTTVAAPGITALTSVTTAINSYVRRLHAAYNHVLHIILWRWVASVLEVYA